MKYFGNKFIYVPMFSFSVSHLTLVLQLSLPITEMLADSELSLPISPTMSLSQAEEVVRLINEWKG